MGRYGGVKRCPDDHKTIYTTRRAALRVARRLPDPDNRVYWCAAAGGHHITRFEPGEYDRRQAGNGKEGAVLERDQQTVDTNQIGRGGDCPTCGWLHGFHDPILHSYHDVYRNLVWKPGQPAPWEKENS